MTGWFLHAWIAFIAFGISPLAGRAVAQQPGITWPVAWFSAVWDTGLLLSYLVSRHWADACTAAAGIAVALGSDWWRRNGKRVIKAAGAKSAALLAAVVERARQAGTPLPEGARA